MGGFNVGAGGSGTGGDPEPVGPPRLTVVNGVVDHDAVRLCFVPYPSGDGPAPWPVLPGLDFAAGREIDPIGAAVPDGTDVQLYVLGGALATTVGQSCAELISSPPASVPIASAGVLPEGALDAERSLLLVLTGCLGGPGHEDEGQASICGAGYGPDTPNVAVAAGAMSRQTAAARIGMQFTHGSAAMQQARLRVKAGIDGASSYVAVNQWTLGSILPYPPWFQFRRQDLGSVGEAGFEVYTASSSTPAHESTFAQAFAHSELGEEDLVDGEGFVFVAVGAMAGVPAGDWWHELSFTVVRADP